jgi:hypothetical protein
MGKIGTSSFSAVLQLRAPERTALLGPPSSAGAVDRQADPAAIIKGFAPLGAATHLCQRLPQTVSIQARRKIAQRVVSEPNRDPQTDSRGRARRGFHGLKARLA